MKTVAVWSAFGLSVIGACAGRVESGAPASRVSDAGIDSSVNTGGVNTGGVNTGGVNTGGVSTGGVNAGGSTSAGGARSGSGRDAQSGANDGSVDATPTDANYSPDVEVGPPPPDPCPNAPDVLLLDPGRECESSDAAPSPDEAGPIALVVDETDVYAWTCARTECFGRGCWFVPGPVYRIPRCGGTATEVHPYDSSEAAPLLDFSLMISGGAALYVRGINDTVLRIPKAGGPATTLAGTCGFGAADATGYWFSCGGEAKRIRTDSQTVDSVIDYRTALGLDGGHAFPNPVVVHDDTLFVADDGAVWSMPIGGASGSLFFQSPSMIEQVLADDDALYVVGSSDFDPTPIDRIPFDGSARSSYALPQRSAFLFGVDAGYLYLALGNQGIERVPVRGKSTPQVLIALSTTNPAVTTPVPKGNWLYFSSARKLYAARMRGVPIEEPFDAGAGAGH